MLSLRNNQSNLNNIIMAMITRKFVADINIKWIITTAQFNNMAPNHITLRNSIKGK